MACYKFGRPDIAPVFTNTLGTHAAVNCSLAIQLILLSRHWDQYHQEPEPEMSHSLN
jgi:hypothetical protein